VSNKLKSIENIIEMSVENFKNKIFLKREEKFEDYLDNEMKRNITYKFIPKTDFKKSPASDIRLKEIKSGSPVLWLKSQKRKEEKRVMKLFEMKDQDVHFQFCKDIDPNHRSTQTSPLLKPLVQIEKCKISEHECEMKIQDIIINELPDTKDLPFDCALDLDISEICLSPDDESSDVHGKILKWKYGDKLADGPSSSVYKAFNLTNGSIFVVKRFHSINDEKMALSYQVKRYIRITKKICFN
jgi:hypothetical protein